MQITLNGQLTELVEPVTVGALLEQLKFSERRVAVEVNGEIVPRSQAARIVVKAGDRVEIVQAIGGG